MNRFTSLGPKSLALPRRMRLNFFQKPGLVGRVEIHGERPGTNGAIWAPPGVVWPLRLLA